MRKENVILWGVAVMLLNFFLLAVSATKEEPQKEEITTPSQVIASYDGKKMTKTALEDILRYRGRGRFLPGRLEQMPPESLKALVEEVVAEELISEKARREKFELPESVQLQLERRKEELLVGSLYKKVVEEKISEITEEKAKKVYEQNIEQYAQPFQFTRKFIFLPTYVEYTTQEGDTLEGIAEKLCDEPTTAILRIVNADTGEPRYVKPEEREEKLFKPLRPGEKLLVPMKEKEKQEVYEKMKKIYEELKGGADFDELAKKYSKVVSAEETGRTIIPEKWKRPISPALVEAAKKTPEGEFSEIIETTYGYQIIKIISKREKQIIPFEQVKERIIAQETMKERREYADTYIKELLKRSPLVKTYPEVLADEKASSVAIVAEIGDLKLSKVEIEQRLGSVAPDKDAAIAQLEGLARLPEVLRIILPAEAKRLKVDKEKEFNSALRQVEIEVYAGAYMEKLFEREIKPTDEELKKYYESNPDKFTTPKQYKLRQILRKIHPQLHTLSEEEREKVVKERIAELEEVRKKIKSVEDFATMAKEHSEDPATKDKGGEVGYVIERYQRGFDGRLEKLKPGEVSEPFEFGAFVYLIMVEDIKEAQLQPFDEAKENVEAFYRSDKRRELHKNLVDQLLKEANYKFIGLARLEKGD